MASLVNPALIEHARRRRVSLENRIADRITAFSGSMELTKALHQFGIRTERDDSP